MNSKIIKEAVESAFNTSINVKSRRREIVYIRSIYYKLCKDFTKESLDAIGKHVNKDHATVLNGLKIFNNIIDNFWEKELFDVYLNIKDHIKTKISLEVKSYDPD
jgi:chromosomal replication initiation ATPase DnaA